MRKITDYDGQVHAPDSDYPDGDVKDNTTGNNGTRVNRKMLADIIQFSFKLMREANIIPNGLPENEYNSVQLFEASRRLFQRRFTNVHYYTASGLDGQGGLVTLHATGNHLVIITAQGASPTDGVVLNGATSVNYATVKFKNSSGSAIDIISPDANSNIEGSSGGAGTPFSLANDTIAEFFLDQSALPVPTWRRIN